VKTALNVAVALTLCALLLAGNAQQAQAEPGPAPGTATQPFPGIIVTPPRLAPQLPASGERAPPAGTQPQSCPDTGRKLELVS
jgi:hypothetical protein